MTDPEKFPLIAQAQVPVQPTARRRQVSKLDVFLLLVIVLSTINSFVYLYNHPYPPHLAHYFNKTPLTWNSGKPVYRSKNSTIPWWPCPDRPPTEMQYCSVLEVPMNWLEPQEGELTKVFMRMIPAEEEKRLGSMLINPGGPGGSGNQFAYRAGKSLSVLTDGRYDIIGFDPRGINMTQPRLSVMPTDFDRAVFDLGSKKPAIAHDPTKTFNASKPRSYESELHRLSTLDTYFSLQKDLIDTLHPESHLASVSTAFVVRDMVAILDGLAEGEGEERGLLTYWGFSYGTILGATFAAMFPERVGKMVLDGVSNAEHYTSSLSDWGYSTLTDNNAVYQEFFLTCAQAGPSRCALSPNSTYDSLTDTERASMVQESVIGLLHKLYERPMEVKGGKSGPGILDYEMYHYVLMNLAYSPSTWQSTALGISQALSGNATFLYNSIPRYTAPATVKQGPRNDTDNVFGMPVGGDAAQSGILCTDLPENGMGLGEYVELGQMYRERGFAGEEWGTIALPCRTWRSRPYERYSGPWHHSQGLRKTRNKVLFVGNTFDPVTPLISARKMAEGFGEASASLLVHEGHGHCSIAEPSLCTIENIRAYLVEGKVPKYDTTCKAEPGFLFPAPVGKLAEFSVAEKENSDMVEAMRMVHGAQVDVMRNVG